MLNRTVGTALLFTVATTLCCPAARASASPKPLAQFVHKSWRAGDGLPNDSISSLLQASSGYLWIGTQGGLARFDGVRFTAFGITKTPGLRSENITALLEDRSGSIWIGTDGGGVSRYSSGKFTAFTTADGLADDSVLSLCQSQDGSIWIGTFGGGISRFADGKFHNYPNAAGLTGSERRAGNVIWSLCSGDGDTLWIGSSLGLARYRDGRFSSLRLPGLLSTVAVRALLRDRMGNLWIGTTGGVCMLGRDGIFQCCTARQGLAGDTVLSILEDRNGGLWFGTSEGVTRFNDKEFESVTVADGLSHNVAGALCQSRDGSLWIGTNGGGLNRLVDENAIASGAEASPTPKVLIEEVRVDGAPVDLGAANAMPPSRGELNFVFTSLSLIAPEKIRFRYLLEGFDTEFRYQSGARGEEHYTNIKPGRYTFKVWAGYRSGRWTELPAEYSFYLEPHFHQTWRFYFLCVLLVALLSGGLYRLITRVHERDLLSLVDERTRQLADANTLLQRLSNLDGLTGIANRRHFEESLAAEWGRARRMGASLALIMMDIDYFKDFNDAYGHQRGDDCLRQVASMLQSSFHRAGDLVARYGGEEFVAVLPNTASESAYRLAETLRIRIDEMDIPHEKSPRGHITISLGLASCVPVEDLAPMDLVALSDRALYRAKKAGRNRTVQADIPILPFATFESTRA